MTLTIDRPATAPPDIDADGTRRELIAAGLGLGAIFLAGCGDDGGEAAKPADERIAFEHSLGRVTLDQRPERVVTLIDRDADTVLALGVTPVAIHSRYGFEAGVGPWAERALGDATPTVWKGLEIDHEAVAAARPDLIVYATSGGEKDVYRTLSGIAPTVALPKGAVPWGASTEASTLLIAGALGRVAEGRRAVAELESYLARQREAHPRFAGRTADYIDASEQGIYTYARDHVINRTLYALGFEPIAPSKESGEGVQISAERLEEYDADIVLAYPFGRTLDELRDASPTLAALPSVREGRFFVLEDLALSNSSVLSIPYALDRLLPKLDEALRA